MRFVDFGELAFNQIAVFPGKSAPGNYYQANLQLFALGDDACVLFVPPPNDNAPLNVYVVDSSGSYTWYATAQFPGATYIESIIPLGPGLFLVSMANNNYTFFVRVSNAKLNNASPILLIKSQSPLTNPCYAANPKIFYDAAKNLLGVGFYSGGSPLSVYASMYRPGAAQLSLLNTGFVGTSESDPFVTANSVSNPNGYPQGAASNGSFYVLNQISPSKPTLILDYVSYDVTQGIQSDCATPCGASVKTYSASSINCGEVSGTPYTTNYCTGGDSSIAGILGVTSTSGTVAGANYVFYTDGLTAFQLYFSGTTAPYDYTATNSALTKKYLFVAALTNSPAGHTAILLAPNPGIVRTPTGQLQSAFVTVNSARPISLTGAYKS